MKLLFDENLSPRPVPLLADIYSGSLHVRDAALQSVDEMNSCGSMLRKTD